MRLSKSEFRWPLVAKEGWVTAASLLLVIPLAFVFPVSGTLGVVGVLLAMALGLYGLRVSQSVGGIRSKPKKEPEAKETSDEKKTSLVPIVLANAFVRLALAGVINLSSLWYAFGPDAAGWERLGWRIYEYWTGSVGYAAEGTVQASSTIFYGILNAGFVAVFGSSRVPLGFLNALLGILVAWLIGRLATELYDWKVGQRAFLLTLCLPSFILWHCQNLKDVWSHLGVAVFVLASIRLRKRLAVSDFAMALASFVLLISIRPYLAPMLAGSVVLSLFVVRVRQLPFAAVSLCVILLLLSRYGENLGIQSDLLSESTLERVNELRRGIAYGGSAYSVGVETNTVAEALAYLPVGIAYFLFSPFPWMARSWRQLMAVPETLVWAYFFLQAMWHLGKEVRRDLARIAMPLIYVVLITCAYSLVSANEGTAYRHRAQVMIIVLIFTAAQQTGWKGRPRVEQQPVI